MFFKLNLLKIFQNFVLKDMLQKWQKRKYYVCHAESIFIKLKDRSSLFKPTQSVITICEETEKCFERMMKVSCGNLPHCSNISEAIVTAVLSGAI